MSATSPSVEASGRRRRLSTEDRRAEILASAIELFAQRDVDRVSMGDIAALADASPALIYHYFGDKAGLAETALNAAADDLITQITPSGDFDPERQLRRTLTRYLDFLEAHRHSWAALLRARGNPTMEAIAQRVDTHASAVTAQLLEATGYQSPVLDLALHGWLELVKGTCLRWLESGEPRRQELERYLVAAFYGIMTAAASER